MMIKNYIRNYSPFFDSVKTEVILYCIYIDYIILLLLLYFIYFIIIFILYIDFLSPELLEKYIFVDIIDQKGLVFIS